MTRDSMLDIINKHNEVVLFINTLDDLMIPVEVVLRLMPLASRFASLGLSIVHEAREMGIDVVCCMQSGRISFK